MLDAQASAVQRLSKTLFGQAHRLAVMVAIAESDGIVNPGDLAAELGFAAQSSIQGPLRDLESAGLISRMPNMGAKTYFRRNPSAAWAWATEIDASLSGTAPKRHDSLR